MLYYEYVRGFRSPEGQSPDGPEFSFLDDEIAYVFPSDAGLTCVALSVNLAGFAWLKKALTERFRDRLTRHRGLIDRYAAATPVGRILGSGPEPNYIRVPVGEGWALVGDAGLHQDPWSGLGMDMAGTHATFLAEAILEWFAGQRSESAALTWYHERRNEHCLTSYRETVTLAQDLRQVMQS